MNVLVKNHVQSVFALLLCCICTFGRGQINTTLLSALPSGAIVKLPNDYPIPQPLPPGSRTTYSLDFSGHPPEVASRSAVALLHRPIEDGGSDTRIQPSAFKAASATAGSSAIFNPEAIVPYRTIIGDTVVNPSPNNALPENCGELKLLVAPTEPVLDDASNTFDWTYSPGYESPELYEFTLDGGTLYQPVTAKPLVIPDDNYAVGLVGIRVREGAMNYASATVYNAKPFTAGAVKENLLAYSENFDRASTNRVWEVVNGGIIKNSTIINPFGQPLSIQYSVNNSTTSSGRLNTVYSAKAGIAYTASIYVKYNNLKSLQIDLNARQENVWAIFDVERGIVRAKGDGCSAAVETAGNGWYRVSVSFTAAATSDPGKLSIFNPYPGEGGNSKGYLLFGAQFNRGSSPAKYIKTP